MATSPGQLVTWPRTRLAWIVWTTARRRQRSNECSRPHEPHRTPRGPDDPGPAARSVAARRGVAPCIAVGFIIPDSTVTGGQIRSATGGRLREMLQTSARLLRLLSLMQARRYWSGAELADRLEVTDRTLRRDVDRLRDLGYPVHSTSGMAGGYRLGAGAALPPLLLEDDEAVAVSVGLRTAAGGTVTGMEEAAVRALAKLEQVLPSRLRR